MESINYSRAISKQKNPEATAQKYIVYDLLQELIVEDSSEIIS